MSRRAQGGQGTKASRAGISRRALVMGSAALAAGGSVAFLIRRKLFSALSRFTETSEFTATPPLVPHDPARERRTIYVAQGDAPAANVDAVLAKLGGIGTVVGTDDLVVIKVSAQWWNQGMTNVAAVKRTIEHILDYPGFRGEVVVFENTHFRAANGSGLTRAFTHPSERNVDVPGWNKLGDLVDHFAKDPRVGFVGLVDGGLSSLSQDAWHDPDHTHGVYGGDGRGPIAPGDPRDGYHWDFGASFRLRRSLVDHAQTPLTWPRFTSPKSGMVVDLRDGIFRRTAGRLEPVGDRKLTFINMTTANEHDTTGLTACCKSAMGIVDMSAGYKGSDPLVQKYQSVHYFGRPDAFWRMAGPLAHFAREVRAPDLHLTVAEWMGVVPAGGMPPGRDHRLDGASANRTRTVVAGTDPVTIDAWVARHLLMPIGGANKQWYDLDDPASRLVKFLRYYRQVYGAGTLDKTLVTVS